MRQPSTILATLAVASLSACSSGPSFVQPLTVEANPNPAVPLAAVARFVPDRPAEAIVAVSDGERSWELRYDASRNPAEGLPVVGMKAGRKHEIRVRLRGASGRETASPAVEYTTPALPPPPEEFPPIRLTIDKPERIEPGYLLLSPRRARVGDPRFGATFGMLMAIDEKGEAVWTYSSDVRISDFERLRNGNLLFVTLDYRLIEVDWLGDQKRVWYAADRPGGRVEGAIPILGTATFHHEVDELPNGNIAVLGSVVREIDNWYTSETDPRAPRQRQRVMGDVVLEFEPDSGKVVFEWNAFDHLPVERLAYETFSGYWERRGFPGVLDWSHANNLIYDASDDSYLINFRYQAAIVKVSRKTGEIAWIVADPDDWGELAAKVLKPIGDTRLPYHQHAPFPTEQGTLLVFDNGNYQARPFRKPAEPRETWTRAVEYRIDPEAGVVEQIWESESLGPESVVSFAMGSVELLPKTGNVLVGYGWIIPRPDVASGKFNWRNNLDLDHWTRIRQFARDGRRSEVVWEVEIGDPEGRSGIGWSLFGVEHLPRF